MKISGQLDWTDYLEAKYLHIRPNLGVRVFWYLLISIILPGFAAYAVPSLLRGQGVPELSYVWPILLVVAVFLLFRYALLPWNIRRVYTQNKELSAPFEHEITPAAITTSNVYGLTSRPWSAIHEWKEDRDYLLLYLSDIQPLIIAKRFCTEEQVETIRRHLTENKVADASKLDFGRLKAFALYFAALLVVALIINLISHNSAP